jgi:Mg/Co/Ni transporter MgtE
MILNELTMDDALEAVREETEEKVWKKARKEARKEVSEALKEVWGEASEATWDEAQKRVIALVKKGLTGEQLEQAIRNERSHVVHQATKTKSSKR